MEIFYKRDNPKFTKAAGVGLGNFDGLHAGHMALIDTLISQCRLNGLYSVIYTFRGHPEQVLKKKPFFPLLTPEGKKAELLSRTSVDCLFFDEFDEEFSRMRPEAFVKYVLLGRLNARLVAAGFNYRFGHRGEGDADLLKEMGEHFGFKVIIIPPVKVGDEVVSSTLIRHYITQGDMKKVFRMLGRHHSIRGRVVKGEKIGRVMGFPTANMELDSWVTLPALGVYVTKTLLDGVLHESITNVGRRPTFGTGDAINLETHILDLERDIYGKEIEVFFLHRLRGEVQFKDVKELREQIARDIGAAREYFKKEGLK